MEQSFGKGAVPRSGSGKSSRRKIFSLAAMPFMAMWKKLPSWRMGMKKSADRRMMSRHPAKSTCPARYWVTERITPRAAPP